MFARLPVAVVIPAFNEADKIVAVLESIPHYIDHVILVDDGSTDRTAQIAALSSTKALEIVRHERNQGVGRAIATGYRRALALGAGAVAVMAGDAQMHPADLGALIEPLAAGRADYAKGNRFRWPGCARVMPPLRFLGNIVLSWLTRIALGNVSLFDSQCGYTAISRQALSLLDLDALAPRYGYPNDILLRLSICGARVIDVPVRPVYGPTWRSGVRIWTALYPITYVLLRGFCRRLASKLKVRFARRRPRHILSANPE